MSNNSSSDSAYWTANVRIIIVSLIIWAVVSFGFGILLRPMLSGISVGGTDLGFWFAQQGLDPGLSGADLFLRLAHEQARPRIRRGVRSKPVDQYTLNLLFVGATFALYIGIAIWARAGSTI
jgi:hypothetical protein